MVTVEFGPVTVSRDGLWPTVWTWRVRATINEHSETHRASTSEYLFGNAFTMKRALRNARRAVDTFEVTTP